MGDSPLIDATHLGLVNVRSDEPLHASWLDRAASKHLLDSMAVAGAQVGSRTGAQSIVLNGRPTTKAAIDEYVAASELSRRTMSTEEGGGGGTRSIWHQRLSDEPGAAGTFIPMGEDAPRRQSAVGGMPHPATGAKYATENQPIPGFGPEGLISHANRMRDVFSTTQALQGTWREDTKGTVAVDASSLEQNPDMARDLLHSREEDALFWPRTYEDVYRDKTRTDPTGLDRTRGGGAEFAKMLTRPPRY